MRATLLQLPDDIEQRLDDLARHTGRSKTFHILEAIREHLDDLEDVYIAEKRLADIRAGHSQTFSIKEVRAELGLDS